MSEKSVIEEKFKQQESEVKFTDEELEKIVKVRDKYLDIQNQFGQSAIVKIRLEERINDLNDKVESLKNDYIENQKVEQEFLEEINNKYGDGELNPESGVFTPKN